MEHKPLTQITQHKVGEAPAAEAQFCGNCGSKGVGGEFCGGCGAKYE